jgi:hypothetical protein
MIRRVMLTLGLLVAVGGCDWALGKGLQVAGASLLSGAMGTLGSYVISTLAALAPTVK